jgi:hypothetical protein
LKKILASVSIVVLVLAMSIMMLSAPNVKAQGSTSDVQVLSYSWYTAPESTPLGGVEYGDLVVVGELQNVGSNTITSVSLTATAYNSSNLAIASSSNGIDLAVMAPQQKSPFYIDFNPSISPTGDMSWVANITSITVTVTNVIDSTQTQYTSLTIQNVNFYNGSNGVYTVTGTILNNGSETATNVWVFTTFYNASGTVDSLNYTITYLSTSLAPGASVPFTATPVDLSAISSQPTNYALLVNAVPASSATPTPPPQTTPTPVSTVSPQATPPPGSSSTMVTYVLIALVVVVIVVVGGLLLLRQRLNRASPSPPLPPPPPPPP